MCDKIKEYINLTPEEIKRRQAIGKHLSEKVKPVIKAARSIYDFYIKSLKAVKTQQENEVEEWISEGYSYSSTFHIISFMTHEIEDEELIDSLFEVGFFEHVQSSYEEVEKSSYVSDVFQTFKRHDMTHHIPFLILLVERLMRILTDNLHTHSMPGEIRRIINKSMIVYLDEDLEELTDDEKNEVLKLNKQINQNTKRLLLKSYNEIVDNDLFKDERYAKGNILNRHYNGPKNLDTKKGDVKVGI